MIIQEWFQDLSGLVTKRHIFNLISASLILAVGIFVAKRAGAAIAKLNQLDTQQRLLLSKVAYYGLITVAVAAGLNQIGLDLRVLLGAAGILTVAIGFAAQTSASNLISGLFLMVDRPFVVGDVVKVGDIQGEVLAIDLLSCKMRTFNNLLVRIPNESMVKSNIINYSFFPIRRLDFNIGVGYETDLIKAEQVLRDVATRHPLCLDEPSPVFVFNGFAEYSLSVQFQVWTLPGNLGRLQNELYSEIKTIFDREGILIPHPTHVPVSAPASGSSTVARS